MGEPAGHGSPYDITPHTQGTRPLRAGDRSRYTQVRITLTRDAAASGTASLIVRTVGSGQARDSRLVVAKVALEPGSEQSVDPLAALEAALQALRAARR